MTARSSSVTARWPWAMLLARSGLFLAFQALVALGYLLVGAPEPWTASAAWWPLGIVATNLVCLAILLALYQREGLRFWDLFRLNRATVKSDLLVILGLLVVGGPVGYLPNVLSAGWLFGDPTIGLTLMVRPLPLVAALLAFAVFPLTQGLVEVPTYMLYVRPRLERAGLPTWTAVALVTLFLSAQHVFAPFLPDGRFVLYRLIMFMPFALLLALLMRWRPRLMPYIAIVHALMDYSLAVFYLPGMMG